MADPIEVEDQSDRYYYDTATGTVRLKPEFQAIGTESLAAAQNTPLTPEAGPLTPPAPPPPPGQIVISPDIPASAGVSTDPTAPADPAPATDPTSAPPLPDSQAGTTQDSGPSLADRVDYLYRRFGIEFPDPNAPEPGGTGVTAPPA